MVRTPPVLLAVALAVVLAALAGCSTSAHPGLPDPRSSSAPTSALAATPSASLGPPGLAPPIGFAPSAVSFLDAHLGFALGVAPCFPQSTVLCQALVRTRDGGVHWAALTAPELTLTDPYWHASLRFANVFDGFAADGVPGDPMQATSDGGQSWQTVSLPGLPVPQVDTVAIAGAHIDVIAGDSTGRYLYISRLHAEGFTRVLGLRLPIANDNLSLALVGTGGWLTASSGTAGARPFYYRSRDGLHWSRGIAPCEPADVAGVAAADRSHVVVVCQAPPTDSQATKSVFESVDGGARFREVGGPGRAGYLAGVSAPSKTSVVVAASSDTDALYRSSDGGRTFQLSFASGGPAQGGGFGLFDLQFTDAQHGTVVLGDTGLYGNALAANRPDVPAPRMLRTVDGGAHWGELLVRT